MATAALRTRCGCTPWVFTSANSSTDWCGYGCSRARIPVVSARRRLPDGSTSRAGSSRWGIATIAPANCCSERRRSSRSACSSALRSRPFGLADPQSAIPCLVQAKSMCCWTETPISSMRSDIRCRGGAGFIIGYVDAAVTHPSAHMSTLDRLCPPPAQAWKWHKSGAAWLSEWGRSRSASRSAGTESRGCASAMLCGIAAEYGCFATTSRGAPALLVGPGFASARLSSPVGALQPERTGRGGQCAAAISPGSSRLAQRQQPERANRSSDCAG